MMMNVKLMELIQAIHCQYIRKAGTWCFIKRPPMLTGGKQFFGRRSGKPLAGLIPDHHAPVGINDKAGNNKMLHKIDGKTVLMGLYKKFFPSHEALHFSSCKK